jgi:hypothetical protein
MTVRKYRADALAGGVNQRDKKSRARSPGENRRSGKQLLLVFLAKFIKRAVDYGDGAIDQAATPAAREHAAEVDQGVHVASRALAGVNFAQEPGHLVRSDLARRALPA